MPAEDAEGRKKLAGYMLRATMSLEKMPEHLRNAPPRLYEPTERGHEAKIKARLDELRALNAGTRSRK